MLKTHQVNYLIILMYINGRLEEKAMTALDEDLGNA